MYLKKRPAEKKATGTNLHWLAWGEESETLQTVFTSWLQKNKNTMQSMCQTVAILISDTLYHVKYLPLQTN